MGGGERELLHAIGSAAQAHAVLHYSSSPAGWRCVSWLAVEVAELLAGWQAQAEPPGSIFPAKSADGVSLTDPWAGLGSPPAAGAAKLKLMLQAGAALQLTPQQGLGPSLLWLGLKQAADIEQLRGVAKLAERLLSPLAMVMQDCLEQLPAVFIAVDMEGTIIYCNSVIRDLGYEPAELIGQSIGLLYAPGERERVRAELDKRPQISRIEALMKNRDGAYVIADMMLSIIVDEHRQPHHIIGIGRNLHEVRQREHHRRLEAVAGLVSGVAHELNNPLMTVLGNAEMMAAMKLPETAHRRAERVLAGARRCQEVVNELLRMKLKSGSSRQQLDAEQLCQRAIKRAREELDASQLVIELISPPAPLLLQGDSVELEQALVNVLKNALQAAAVAPDPVISVGLAGIEGFAQIRVHDNGSGMSQEALDRAFEPFFTTREIGAGRGLGLSTALAIVQEHGGGIDLQANSQGTEVLITLPM